MNQAPSSAATYVSYSKLQKDRLDAPFFLSGRPAGAKVRLMTHSLPQARFGLKHTVHVAQALMHSTPVHCFYALSCWRSSVSKPSINAGPPAAPGPQIIWGV